MPSAFDPERFQSALRTRLVGRFLIYREQVDTTMILARREGAEGAPHGTLVLAEEQIAGRGRKGRGFHSPPTDNLYFTLVLRLPLEVHARLPVILPVAVCSAIRSEGLDARIKWPNDVWAGERKLCGMLIDAEVSAGAAIAMPGIGINVNGDPTLNPELADIATSIARELRRPVSREELLARTCNELEAAIAIAPDALLSRYRQLSMILERAITVHPPSGDPYEATAVDIGPGGELLATRSNGRTERLNAADVTVRPR